MNLLTMLTHTCNTLHAASLFVSCGNVAVINDKPMSHSIVQLCHLFVSLAFLAHDGCSTVSFINPKEPLI